MNLDDLIRAYLRFKEWMDYDVERSAYCAKEISVMQKLFGTAYVTVPAGLVNASYDELLSIMDKRISDMQELSAAIDDLADESVIDELFRIVDKTSFQSSVHYFPPLFQVLWQTIGSARLDTEPEQEKVLLDLQPIEDYFDEVTEPSFEEIRAFIISEHLTIESLSYSREMAYAMGLPKQAPDPIPCVIH